MAHKNGNDYQIRIVRNDGTENLSEWMHSIEEVAHAMILIRKPQGAKCWLMVRSITWPYCPDLEQILEYPIMNIPPLRYIPHNPRFLQVAGPGNRCAEGFTASRHAP